MDTNCRHASSFINSTRTVIPVLVLGLCAILTTFLAVRLVNNQIEVVRAVNGEIPLTPYHNLDANDIVIERWLSGRSGNSARVQAIAEYQSKRKPFWAPYYYQKSWLNLDLNEKERAIEAITAAVELWPERGILLSSAAEVMFLVNEDEKAIDFAKKAFWSHHLSQQIPLNHMYDNEVDLIGMVPELLSKQQRDIRKRNIDYVGPFNRFAMSQNDYELIETSVWYANWQAQPWIFNGFAAKTLEHNRPEDLFKQRTRIGLKSEGENLLVMGGFEKELNSNAMGWVVGNAKSISTRIDNRQMIEGASSLRVQFEGDNNVNLYWPYQFVPITTNAKRFLLSGKWKGKDITTRSTPGVEVVAVRGKVRKRIAGVNTKRGSWDWEAFDLPIEIQETVPFLMIRVRRRPTSDLDKNIDGTFWLDDLKLVALSEGVD